MMCDTNLNRFGRARFNRKDTILYDECVHRSESFQTEGESLVWKEQQLYAASDDPRVRHHPGNLIMKEEQTKDV